MTGFSQVLALLLDPFGLVASVGLLIGLAIMVVLLAFVLTGAAR